MKTTDPELPALVWHRGLRGRLRGGHKRETVEQSGREEQCDPGAESAEDSLAENLATYCVRARFLRVSRLSMNESA